MIRTIAEWNELENFILNKGILVKAELKARVDSCSHVPAMALTLVFIVSTIIF